MSTPSGTTPDLGASQHAHTPSVTEDSTMDEIPRRQMRVKVLYTFDDQNKSNCLARLPSVLNVPVVSLDETTEVGVIELKTCIQAIVAASPELVAKLGHDFTVYAYDFSEYETPLVGQGMLSWILASASATPNAPAKDSQTMVTGRVCKNILGIFSNGVKETLEVKLKLVPVPTCMQKEYVENMERYHSLSQLMPEGFDYNAWSDFLRENPTLGHLAQPSPYPAQPSPRPSIGGVEPFHQMLTRHSPSQEPPRNDSFYDQSNMSFMSQPTRASSPAMSTLSFHHYQYNPPSRPTSRASVRSEAAPPPQQLHFSDPYVIEQQEDGPPKKRARITQTTRPRNTPLNAHNDSLRVTASTAASVRLLKPALSTSGAASDMVPRAPTPRPGEKFGQRGSRRPPAPSTLRHASMDGGRPYMSPYESSAFSDNALESADERDGSPGDTPMPSSPPIGPNRTASPDGSSPNLPTLPPNDSGFVSDMPTSRDGNSMELDKLWHDGALQEQRRKSITQPVTESIEMDMGTAQAFDFDTMDQDIFSSVYFQGQDTNDDNDLTARLSMAQQSNNLDNQTTDAFQKSRATVSTAGSPDGMVSQVSPTAESEAPVYSRSATPNPPPKQTKSTKPRGLPRSHTWSGAEPMSDAPTPSEYGYPRSGSGAKRKRIIKNKLDAAIRKGEMPTHCVNCGEIDTVTWRKAYTRVEKGSPKDIELSTDSAGTDIIAYEVIEPTSEDGELKYRIFKNNLTREDKDIVAAKSSDAFEELNLCNPCGLWLIKKFSMRPQKVWDRAARLANRKKQQKVARSKSMSGGDDLMSDAVLPESEPAMPAEQEQSASSIDRTHDGTMAPPVVAPSARGLDSEAAQAALERALESSPVGVRGSKASPIEIDQDLTPKPTRRLLFPSPRKQGRRKTLAEPPPAPVTEPIATPMYLPDDDAPKKPRCQRCKELKRGCDRERPCGRCENAGIGHNGCIPCVTKQTYWFEQPVVQVATVDQENPDKENCPPPTAEADDLAHLFEDSAPPKTTPKSTPKKDQIAQDPLKTPTPNTRKRIALTPRRGAGNGDAPSTPSRNILTPRTTRAATAVPDTPFTRQLNALLSDHPISSPSQAIDFSAFPTFTTPGRTDAQFCEFLPDDFLSSDMPASSSPSKNGSLGLGFDLYEDPNTSTVGLWSGDNIFDNETMMLDMKNGSRRGSVDGDDRPDAATLLKMNVGGMTVDFAAMIEEVVGAANKEADPTKATSKYSEKDIKLEPESPEAESEGAGKTPDEPTV